MSQHVWSHDGKFRNDHDLNMLVKERDRELTAVNKELQAVKLRKVEICSRYRHKMRPLERLGLS